MDRQIERFEGRFIRFGAAILAITRQMPRSAGVRHVADQLFRSGSSAGANVAEAQSAQSTADFISKMEIALKEIRETRYWLALAQAANLLNDTTLALVEQECEELTAMLAKSVLTAKANRNRQRQGVA